MSYEFKEQIKYDTKYGFPLRFTYFVAADWFYDQCKIEVKTFHQRNIIYKNIIRDYQYDSEIDNIRKEMSKGKYLNEIIKDYGRCVACKQINVSNDCNWLYDENGMFCSYDCQRKPFADKCTLCSRDIPRRFGQICPDQCSVKCFVKQSLLEKTLLSMDVISNIVEMV